MQKTILLLSVLLTSSFIWAGTPNEDEQDRSYLQCLIKRKVDPPNIPPEDSQYCMKEAGVKDPGDAARKEKGTSWRNCLIGHAANLDDGISPATEISKAIIVLCQVEWKEYVGSLAMYPSAKRAMSNGFELYAVGDGIQAVLLTRRLKREMAVDPAVKKK